MLRSFTPPVFATPEQTLRARILHLVVGSTVLVAVGFLPLIVVTQPATTSRGVSAVVFISALGLVVLHLNRSGRTRPGLRSFGDVASMSGSLESGHDWAIL